MFHATLNGGKLSLFNAYFALYVKGLYYSTFAPSTRYATRPFPPPFPSYIQPAPFPSPTSKTQLPNTIPLPTYTQPRLLS